MDECNNKDLQDAELVTRIHQLGVELAKQQQMQLPALEDYENQRRIRQRLFFSEIEVLRREDAAIARFMEKLVPFHTTTKMGKNDLMLLLYPPNNTLTYPNPNSSN